MKKSIITLLAMVFLVATTGTAFAWNQHYAYSRPSHHYHGYGHGHYYGNGDAFWAFLGVGVLTGALISTLASPPPPPAVVYTTSQPVVLAPPPPVVVREYAYAPPPRATSVEIVVVTAQELNVRSGPGLNQPIAGYVVQGESLQVMGSAPGWYYVRTAKGLNGWVMTSFTAPQAGPMG